MTCWPCHTAARGSRSSCQWTEGLRTCWHAVARPADVPVGPGGDAGEMASVQHSQASNMPVLLYYTCSMLPATDRSCHSKAHSATAQCKARATLVLLLLLLLAPLRLYAANARYAGKSCSLFRATSPAGQWHCMHRSPAAVPAAVSGAVCSPFCLVLQAKPDKTACSMQQQRALSCLACSCKRKPRTQPQASTTLVLCCKQLLQSLLK